MWFILFYLFDVPEFGLFLFLDWVIRFYVMTLQKIPPPEQIFCAVWPCASEALSRGRQAGGAMRNVNLSAGALIKTNILKSFKNISNHEKM